MNHTATLSVLMPNYNHARHLPLALEAIFSQSRQPDQVVIIDDGSTDDSLEVLEAYAARHPVIELLRNPRNLGVVENINRLIRLNTSSHAIFLAADDIILPGLFEKGMSLLSAHPRAGLCSGLIHMLREDGLDMGLMVTPLATDQPAYLSPEDVLRQLMTEGPWIVNNTSIYRMEALIQAGGFYPQLEAFSDGFLSDVIALSHGACFIPEALACWRVNPKVYAYSTSGDLDRITKVMARALELMRTRHAAVFPRRYRDLFRRHLCKRYNPNINLPPED